MQCEYGGGGIVIACFEVFTNYSRTLRTITCLVRSLLDKSFVESSAETR